MSDMISVILEDAPLDEELDEKFGYARYDYRNKKTDNSRNGHSRKTMHTSYGDMDVAIPRDRNGEHELQLIRKYQNTVTQDMEEKTLSMYAKGITTDDTESHGKELYDMDVSDSTSLSSKVCKYGFDIFGVCKDDMHVRFKDIKNGNPVFTCGFHTDIAAVLCGKLVAQGGDI